MFSHITMEKNDNETERERSNTLGRLTRISVGNTHRPIERGRLREKFVVRNGRDKG